MAEPVRYIFLQPSHQPRKKGKRIQPHNFLSSRATSRATRDFFSYIEKKNTEQFKKLINLKLDNPINKEPQYETDQYYAVTGFGDTIDKAAKKAVNFMIDHLVANYDISDEDAYMLFSLVGDLKIAEVVDVPNMLVIMYFPKSILTQL